MEISLAEKRAYYFVPQISLDIGRDRRRRRDDRTWRQHCGEAG